ncbi:hypothetical protein [Aureimonas endophytica]|nr:hypothetical protein [Aureimonas endophytica]
MWVEAIPGPDLKPIEGLSLKVRGTDSDAYAFALSRKQLAADGADLEADGSIKPEAMLRIRQELLHEVVLLDWSGLTSGEEKVGYDPDLARQWLLNPDYRDFQDLVQRAAGIANRRVREKTEAAVKN